MVAGAASFAAVTVIVVIGAVFSSSLLGPAALSS
jgi:hypothetical protein